MQQSHQSSLAPLKDMGQVPRAGEDNEPRTDASYTATGCPVLLDAARPERKVRMDGMVFHMSEFTPHGWTKHGTGSSALLLLLRLGVCLLILLILLPIGVCLTFLLEWVGACRLLLWVGAWVGAGASTHFWVDACSFSLPWVCPSVCPFR